MRITANIVIVIISISIARSQSTIADVPRLSIEQTNGYSFLIDAKTNPYLNYPYYKNQTPVTLDHYNYSFVNTGFAVSCNLNERKNMFGDPYFLSLGIGFSEWAYTLRREYLDYNYNNYGASNNKITAYTASNNFKVLRHQLCFFLKKTYLTSKKFKLDRKISFLYWFQTQSAPKQLQYLSSISAYSYQGNYYNQNIMVDTFDVYKEKPGFAVAVSIPATYEIKKNLFLFFEPGITLSSWNMNYNAIHVGGGWGVFANLYFGLRYNFLKRKS